MNKGKAMTDLTTMMMSEAIVSQGTSNCGLAPPNKSRREFIKGVIASGAVASAGVFMLVGCSDDSARGGRVESSNMPASSSFERMITLNINGRDRVVDVLPNETLVMTLRYKLGLTGTKLGCDRGECGACTVNIDDVQQYSCSTLTHTVRGRAINTIEGMQGANGELNTIQQAFIDELGPQCGFCTPGQIMSTVSLLKSNSDPTREEARVALSGNLCRCGAYDHYLNSVMRAAKEV